MSIIVEGYRNLKLLNIPIILFEPIDEVVEKNK